MLQSETESTSPIQVSSPHCTDLSCALLNGPVVKAPASWDGGSGFDSRPSQATYLRNWYSVGNSARCLSLWCVWLARGTECIVTRFDLYFGLSAAVVRSVSENHFCCRDVNQPRNNPSSYLSALCGEMDKRNHKCTAPWEVSNRPSTPSWREIHHRHKHSVPAAAPHRSVPRWGNTYSRQPTPGERPKSPPG